MLGAFTHLTRPSFVSGIGVLLQKGRLFGDKSFVVNIGKWKGIGALMKREAVMALGYGRPLGSCEI